MMFLKPEERDSASLTSKHDKGVFCNNFSIYIYIYICIYIYIYIIIFHINILFCLLSFDEITKLVIQNESNVSSIYFHPINSDVQLFKQQLLVTLSVIPRCSKESEKTLDFLKIEN